MPALGRVSAEAAATVASLATAVHGSSACPAPASAALVPSYPAMSWAVGDTETTHQSHVLGADAGAAPVPAPVPKYPAPVPAAPAPPAAAAPGSDWWRTVSAAPEATVTPQPALLEAWAVAAQIAAELARLAPVQAAAASSKRGMPPAIAHQARPLASFQAAPQQPVHARAASPRSPPASMPRSYADVAAATTAAASFSSIKALSAPLPASVTAAALPQAALRGSPARAAAAAVPLPERRASAAGASPGTRAYSGPAARNAAPAAAAQPTSPCALTTNGTSARSPRDRAAAVHPPAAHCQLAGKGSSAARNNGAPAAPLTAATGSHIHRGNGFAVLAGLGSAEWQSLAGGVTGGVPAPATLAVAAPRSIATAAAAPLQATALAAAQRVTVPAVPAPLLRLSTPTLPAAAAAASTASMAQSSSNADDSAAALPQAAASERKQASKKRQRSAGGAPLGAAPAQSSAPSLGGAYVRRSSYMGLCDAGVRPDTGCSLPHRSGTFSLIKSCYGCGMPLDKVQLPSCYEHRIDKRSNVFRGIVVCTHPSCNKPSRLYCEVCFLNTCGNDHKQFESLFEQPLDVEEPRLNRQKEWSCFECSGVPFNRVSKRKAAQAAGATHAAVSSTRSHPAAQPSEPRRPFSVDEQLARAAAELDDHDHWVFNAIACVKRGNDIVALLVPAWSSAKGKFIPVDVNKPSTWPRLVIRLGPNDYICAPHGNGTTCDNKKSCPHCLAAEKWRWPRQTPAGTNDMHNVLTKTVAVLHCIQLASLCSSITCIKLLTIACSDRYYS